jgi:site-specific recombinase
LNAPWSTLRRASNNLPPRASHTPTADSANVHLNHKQADVFEHRLNIVIHALGNTPSRFRAQCFDTTSMFRRRREKRTEIRVDRRDELFVLFTDRLTLANMDYAQTAESCELRRLKRKYRHALQARCRYVNS